MSYPLVTLGEILTHHKTYIDQPEARQYPKLSVKLYGRGVILDAPVDGSALKMKRHQLAKTGQVILSEIWGKKGAIGFVPPEGSGALCTSHFFLFDINPERIEQKYLNLIFQGNWLQSQLSSEAFGTTGYAAVRPQHLLKAKIPLPPISEQRRIVARVEVVAGRITEARRLREEAATEADMVSTTSVANLIDAPTWPSAKLGNCLAEDSRNGISTKPDDSPPGVPLLRISAGTSRQDRLVDESDYKYLPADIDSVKDYHLRAGDLLACRFNGNLSFVGRFTLYAGESGLVQVYPDKLIRFRPDPTKLSANFARYALNSPAVRKTVEGMCATTAGNIGISAGQLKTIAFPLPPLSEQQRIVTHLDALQAKVDTLRALQAETSAELDALLPAVLAKAFGGEL